MLLTLVATGALILRVAYVYGYRGEPPQPDGVSYRLAALALRNGGGFLNPISGLPAAFHPPLWTIVLTIPPLLGRSSQLSAQLFASFVGVMTVIAVGFAGRRVKSERVGLIAAVVAALYPGLWGYERALLSETLLFLGIALLIIAAYRYLAEPSRWKAVQLGALCGLLALTRGEQILLVPVLLVPLTLGWRWRGFTRQRFACLGLACAATVLVIVPWSLYSTDRLGKPVLVTDSFGATVAQGNCDSVYFGERLGFYDFNCLKSNAVAAARRGSKDPLGDSALRKEALIYLGDHLDRLPVVLAARQGRTWSLYEPFRSVDLERVFPPSVQWPETLDLVCFWLLLPLALIGGVVLRKRRVPLLPLIAPFVVTVVTVTVTYGEPRLRAAAEMPLVLLAAVGIDRLSRWNQSETATDHDVAATERSLAVESWGADGSGALAATAILKTFVLAVGRGDKVRRVGDGDDPTAGRIDH